MPTWLKCYRKLVCVKSSNQRWQEKFVNLRVHESPWYTAQTPDCHHEETWHKSYIMKLQDGGRRQLPYWILLYNNYRFICLICILLLHYHWGKFSSSKAVHQHTVCRAPYADALSYWKKIACVSDDWTTLQKHESQMFITPELRRPNSPGLKTGYPIWRVTQDWM